MSQLLSIGDFARASQLSIKTLRHYHEQELLEPTEIDTASGYRRYSVDLLPTAQIIRRLRALDMPIAEVRGILHSDDVASRNDVIAHHLARLQSELASTQAAVAALQDLLEHPQLANPIEHRKVPATAAAAIVEEIDISAAEGWLAGALGELYAVLDDQRIAPGGDAGGIYADELFASERGRAIVYIPVAGDARPTGRIRMMDLPAVELAVITHTGPYDGMDREYGALAEHVARHELAVEGSIHEFYPVGRHHTADRSKWRTEIGWPILATG